jgi:prephenate dehydratase
MKVGTLGPETTFSCIATHRYLEREHLRGEIHYSDTIGECFDELANLERIVVPYRNTIVGEIDDTTERLDGHRIVGRIEIPIKMCLATRSSVPISQIRRVYSKDKALGQCRGYLGEHLPDAEQVGVGSTAKAGEMICDLDDCAAIVSQETAKKYNLVVVAGNIQDVKENATEFVILERA